MSAQIVETYKISGIGTIITVETLSDITISNRDYLLTSRGIAIEIKELECDDGQGYRDSLVHPGKESFSLKHGRFCDLKEGDTLTKITYEKFKRIKEDNDLEAWKTGIALKIEENNDLKRNIDNKKPIDVNENSRSEQSHSDNRKLLVDIYDYSIMWIELHDLIGKISPLIVTSFITKDFVRTDNNKHKFQTVHMAAFDKTILEQVKLYLSSEGVPSEQIKSQLKL